MPFFYNYNIKYGKCQDLNLLLSVFSNSLSINWFSHTSSQEGNHYTINYPTTLTELFCIECQYIGSSNNGTEGESQRGAASKAAIISSYTLSDLKILRVSKVTYKFLIIGI